MYLYPLYLSFIYYEPMYLFFAWGKGASLVSVYSAAVTLK